MIKNTSGLAVQPCRLHERFYYHARLLYYILRQKARGFFDVGAGAPADPFFLSASPEGGGGGGGPALPFFSLCLPGGGWRGWAAPAPTDAGAPPRAPGDFLMRRKSPKTHQEPPGSWTSGEGGLAPFDPPVPCPSGIGCGGLNLQASSQFVLLLCWIGTKYGDGGVKTLFSLYPI